jgi:2-polyprenyl-3-methyl-5-hydroxy-6-metoxy-1,4-benzoquinol methylase
MAVFYEITKIFSFVLRTFFRFIPTKMRRLIIQMGVLAESRESVPYSLIFLLDLDRLVYQLTGNKSIEYNKGQHIKHRVTGYHDFFVERIEPGESIVDIGCGKGEIAFKIATKAGGIVIGIDNNKESIEFAKKNYKHPDLRFIYGDVLKFLPPQTCNTVLLSNVLEHIEDRIPFLYKIQSHFQPDRLLLRVPMFNRDWRVPLRKELGLSYFLDSTHCTEYTQESFEREISVAGMRLTHMEIRWGEIWAEAVPDA